MSRRDDDRLADIIAAADAIASHLERGGLDDGLVFDAVRVRLIEIGEAVKERWRPSGSRYLARHRPARFSTEPMINLLVNTVGTNQGVSGSEAVTTGQ